MLWVRVPCTVSQLSNCSGVGIVDIITFRGKAYTGISLVNFPHICFWRWTGEANVMISSTQLPDGDEKGMRKSGPGVAHICKPREMQPMKIPEPKGQKCL